MWTKQILFDALGRKPFITKAEFLKKTPYKKYDSIKPFFDGLETLPGKRVYLTKDVVERIMELREYGD